MSLWWHSTASTGSKNEIKPENKKEFEHYCPILILISDLPKKEYFAAVKKIIRKIVGDDFPDPRTDRKHFLNFLKKNQTKFRLTTKKKLNKQIKVVPYKYPINTLLFELSQNIENENLLISSLPSLLQENRFFDKHGLSEQLFNHYFPFISIYRPEDKITHEALENQLNIWKILEYAVLHYPNFAHNMFYERISKFFLKIADYLIETDNTLTANIWRVFYHVFPRVFEKFNVANARELLMDLSVLIMAKCKNPKAFVILLQHVRIANFKIGNYYSSKLLEIPHLIQQDYDILDTITQNNVLFEYPLYILRNLLQVFIMGDIFSRIAYKLIKDNIKYFSSSKRLHNWTEKFLKRSFQWIYVVDTIDKYVNRRKLVLFQLYRLHKLNIPGMRETICNSARSLYLTTPSQELLDYFPEIITSTFDPTFYSDFEGLVYHSDQLKEHLIWPQERLYYPRPLGNLSKKFQPRRISPERIKDSTSSSESSSESSVGDSSDESYEIPKRNYSKNSNIKETKIHLKKGKKDKEKKKKQKSSKRKYSETSDDSDKSNDSYSDSEEEIELVSRKKESNSESEYDSTSYSDSSSDIFGENNEIDDNVNNILFTDADPNVYHRSQFDIFLFILFTIFLLCLIFLIYVFIIGPL